MVAPNAFCKKTTNLVKTTRDMIRDLRNVDLIRVEWSRTVMTGLQGFIASTPINPGALGLFGGASSTGLAGGMFNAVPAGEQSAWGRTGLDSAPLQLAKGPANAGAGAAPASIDKKTLGLLAADVYQASANPPPGFREATASDLKALKLKPTDLVSADSPFRARVYATGAGADTKYVVAFRGSTTEQKNADWIANARQGIGLNSDHYTKAQTIGQQIAESGNKNVSLVGHSLGGGLASATAIASGRDATTFNAAGLSKTTIDAATKVRLNAGVANAGNVNAYYVRGEVLSNLQDGGDRLIGGIVGAVFGGFGGATAGASAANLPEAYGKRIALDPVRPQGAKDTAIARHMMDWVNASLNK
jgi:hypothetical protein